MSTFTYEEFDKDVHQGNDRVIKMQFDATVADWEVFYTAKKNFTTDDDEAAIKVDTTEAVFSDSGVGFINTIEIWLTSAKTNIEPGDYNHDIKIIKSNGNVNTIMEGVLTIKPQQTQRKS